MLIACALGCASGDASLRLDRVYEPGAARAVGAKRTQRQVNEFAYTRLRDQKTGQLELRAEMREALGARLSTAVGYDAYRVRLKRGRGYSVSWRRYCDYVFFDDSQQVVGSYRHEGGC